MRARFKGWWMGVLLLGIVGWAFSQPEPAGPLGEPLITLDLERATLREALKQLGQQAPISYVAQDKVLDQITVTAHLRNIPATQALMALARAAGCQAEMMPGGVMVFVPPSASGTPGPPTPPFQWLQPGGGPLPPMAPERPRPPLPPNQGRERLR